jgi:hypothetical protein
MKFLFLLITLSFVAFGAKAETCNAVIKDRFGSVLERFTESSYSRDAACGEAMFQCNRSLSDARSSGRYYDANCEVEAIYNPYPGPIPTPGPGPGRAYCSTDLVDQWNRTIRSFSGTGYDMREACAQSEAFCRDELYRSNSYGARCVTNNGGNGGGNPIPNPPRNRTESCEVHRFDPAGFFIQSYFNTANGPFNTDVKRMACDMSLSQCQRDLKGRQYCNVVR